MLVSDLLSPKYRQNRLGWLGVVVGEGSLEMARYSPVGHVIFFLHHHLLNSDHLRLESIFIVADGNKTDK